MESSLGGKGLLQLLITCRGQEIIPQFRDPLAKLIYMCSLVADGNYLILAM